jgi:dienelactone hydrolase
VRSGLRIFVCILLLPAACGEAESGSASGGGTAFLGTSRQSTLPSDLAGHWFLDREGERVTLNITQSGVNFMAGISRVESAVATDDVIESLDIDTTGLLQVRVAEPGGTLWYRVRAANGVLAGRYARSTGSAPGWPADYKGRVTGWRQETFDADIAPRVWDISLPGGQRAVLRMDRATPGSSTFIGTLKPYALQGQLAEHPAEQIDVQVWNGQSLTFVRRATTPPQTYQGTVTGRLINGQMRGQPGGAVMTWDGTRAEVLTHGLGARTAQQATEWQTLTRQRLGLLALGGNPKPQSTHVSQLGSSDPIATDDGEDPFRDDDAAERPQTYTLTELAFDSRVPDFLDAEPLIRRAHGYVAVPTTAPPPGGYPVALALNGHGGSARDTFDAAGMYWYGDSFARRGFLVISVDIGHRPLQDRAAIYTDSLGGDDPDTGNGMHPAIASPGRSPDWEEDGERAWDAMRALDYALSRPDVNPKNVTAVGLSMGGEITDWVAALDTRIAVAVAAGSPSDLAVMSLHGNHPCWMWQRGDAREYYDPGDLNALVASRMLVRETGKQDTCYSNATPPFGSAKEVVWRAQPAFQALGGQLIHYLHFDAHAFQVGQFCTAESAADGVTVPVVQGPSPADPWATDWSSNGTTTAMVPSIFAITPGSVP